MYYKFPFPITVLLFLIFTFSIFIYSDGGFISNIYADIWEPRQVALIKYDAAHSTEQIILLTKFEGKTRDFCWIVPTPSVPLLQEEHESLFYELNQWTATYEYFNNDGSGCCSSNDAALAPQPNVEVFNEQQIGYFQTITVGADSSSYLIDSLTAWGYFNQQNAQHYQPVLDWYIAKDWVFTVIRIDSNAELQQNEDGNWYGNLEPLSFSFNSDSIIYPLKISSVSTQNESMILLYVVANHRMIFNNANTEWADRIDSVEASSIKNYWLLEEYIQEGDYLTKLRSTFTASMMDDDLIITQASTDEEYFPDGSRAAISIEWILILIAFMIYRKFVVKGNKGSNLKEKY